MTTTKFTAALLAATALAGLAAAPAAAAPQKHARKHAARVAHRDATAELRAQLEMLPGGIEDGQLSPAAKAALQVETDLRIADPETMSPERLDQLAASIGMLADLVAAAYFV